MPASAGEEPAGCLCLSLAKPARGPGVNQARVERSKRLLSPSPARATSREPPPCGRARGGVRSAAARRTHPRRRVRSCREDQQGHRVHLSARSFAVLPPEIPQPRRTGVPRLQPDEPTTRAAAGLQPRSDSRKDDTGREGGPAPTLPAAAVSKGCSAAPVERGAAAPAEQRWFPVPDRAHPTCEHTGTTVGLSLGQL